MVRDNTRGSLPAWKKPVDQGSNPCVPTPPREGTHAIVHVEMYPYLCSEA